MFAPRIKGVTLGLKGRLALPGPPRDPEGAGGVGGGEVKVVRPHSHKDFSEVLDFVVGGEGIGRVM